ncbi:potassium channel protein [Candidatus Bathyarchaeota archaeon]|nr:potassium channel protein [Candidatus Bathyarchaeota archaeon]MBS7627325.1 potassium channel protein [Candidatus Bathyarchaeota archaeon]
MVKALHPELFDEDEEGTLIEHTPIHYQPISVRDALRELKDLSELMIDLAYSSVLFRDNDLAEEVLVLTERVDRLSYLLIMNAALAVRDKRDAEHAAGILKATDSIHKIASAATDIAIVQLHGIGIHPTVQEAFKKAEERFVRATISNQSILAGKRLQELSLESRIGVGIISLRRGKRWILNPKPTFKLSPGDVAIAKGSERGILQFLQLAKGDLREVP